MGGTTSRDQVNDEISSIKKLKQSYYVDVAPQRKKKSLIFGSLTWRKFVESTKKKSNRNMTLLRLDSPCERKTNPFHADAIDAGNCKNPGSLSNEIVTSKKTSDHLLPLKRTLNTSRESLETSRLSNKQQHGQLSRSDAFSRPRSNVPSYASTRKSNPVAREAASNHKPRKHLIQASTSELLDCLGQFVCQRCHRVKDLEPSDIPTWFREVDRALFKLGWHEISFIMPSSVVFVYLLCREMLVDSLTTSFEVQCIVLTCLYMSYSYMGNEISYPLRPFLIEQERAAFWSRCCMIVKRLSGAMLRINNNSHCFTMVFRDLIAFAPRPLTSHSETAVFRNRTVVSGERRR